MKRITVILALGIFMVLLFVSTTAAQTADPIADLKATAGNDPFVSAAIDRVVAGDTSDVVINVLKAEAARNPAFADAMSKVPGWDLYFAPPAPQASATPPAPAATAPAGAAAAGQPSWFGQPTPQPQTGFVSCPPPIYNVGSGAAITATLKYTDSVLFINVSRDMKVGAFAGPGSESNFLLGLKPGISKIQIVWDGSGQLYPFEMTNAGHGCQLEVETAYRGGNWPDKLVVAGLPDVFIYHHPFGTIETQSYRWPDLIHAIRWWDAAGMHEWQNPGWTNPQVVTAESWWTTNNSWLSRMGMLFGSAPAQPQGSQPAPSATAPAPSATPQVTCNLKTGDVAVSPPNTQTTVSAQVCGYNAIYFWKPGVPERVFVIHSDSMVDVKNVLGKITHFDNVPSLGDLGKTAADVASAQQLQDAGIAINGQYTAVSVK